MAGAPRLAVNAIATGDGQRLAVGGTDGHPAVWRQDAGGAWTLVTSLSGLPAQYGTAALTSVVHGPAGWLAVGTPWPVSLTSGDGVTWRPGGPDSDDLAGVLSIAAAGGPHGYVVLGKALATSGPGCVADVWWSPDLRTWTRAHDVNATNGSSQTLAVAAKTNGFVSAGSHNGRPAVWVTTNGPTWRTIVLPSPANAQLNQIAVHGNLVVATGGWDHQHAVTPAFAEVSADGGLHWQMARLNLPATRHGDHGAGGHPQGLRGHRQLRRAWTAPDRRLDVHDRSELDTGTPTRADRHHGEPDPRDHRARGVQRRHDRHWAGRVGGKPPGGHLHAAGGLTGTRVLCKRRGAPIKRLEQLEPWGYAGGPAATTRQRC